MIKKIEKIVRKNLLLAVICSIVGGYAAVSAYIQNEVELDLTAVANNTLTGTDLVLNKNDLNPEKIFLNGESSKTISNGRN